MRGQGIHDDKLTVIPNAVPIRGPLSDRAQPNGRWTIGICALFRPRKGVDVLVRALAELKRQGLPVRLRAVGYFMDDAYERHIKTLVSDLGLQNDVQWVGFSDNVYDELSKMDLFVYPSTHGEGMPLAILEAMAAGVPVVSTNVEGTPEAIRAGIDAVIVDPNNVEALADGFRRIIEGDLDWNALRLSAHRRQAERYSDTELARDVSEVYDRVLNRER
jgi:glycosyltransferase involved in cell wall biosynthesis